MDATLSQVLTDYYRALQAESQAAQQIAQLQAEIGTLKEQLARAQQASVAEPAKPSKR